MRNARETRRPQVPIVIYGLMPHLHRLRVRLLSN